jgi:hypothetical protein
LLILTGHSSHNGQFAQVSLSKSALNVSFSSL